MVLKKLIIKIGGGKKMSVSENVSEKDERVVYFHGKDVRDKKFQKRINKKASLAYAILTNAALIIGFIMIIFIITLLGG